MIPTAYEFRTILKMLKPPSGNEHAERLESFYSGQAGDYDEFRKKLLPGRERMINELAPHAGGVWADLGCGTGSNLELFATAGRRAFKKIHLVDLAPSLLKLAEQRVSKLELDNVEVHEQDVCKFDPGQALDLVTFSYSLTMIPRWYLAIEHAIKLLKPGGRIAVTDFYISEKYPGINMELHSGWTRHFWRVWFSWDNVFLSTDHLPYLMENFTQEFLYEGRHTVPFVPLGRVPYYIFIGTKPNR